MKYLRATVRIGWTLVVLLAMFGYGTLIYDLAHAGITGDSYTPDRLDAVVLALATLILAGHIASDTWRLWRPRFTIIERIMDAGLGEALSSALARRELGLRCEASLRHVPDAAKAELIEHPELGTSFKLPIANDVMLLDGDSLLIPSASLEAFINEAVHA